MLLWLASNWKLVVIGTIIFALGAYGQTMRIQRDMARNEYSDFRREVALAAQKAAEQALQKTIADEKKKEEADADNLRLRNDLAVLTKRLRDARANSQFLPAAPADSGSPASACFSRPDLERALQRLDAGVSDLLAEGDRAVVDLETAKAWARASRQ